MRLKGPIKAQIRLRVRKPLADYATEMGAHWLEGLIEREMLPKFVVRAGPATAESRAKTDALLQPQEIAKPAASISLPVGRAAAAPGSRLKKR